VSTVLEVKPLAAASIRLRGKNETVRRRYVRPEPPRKTAPAKAYLTPVPRAVDEQTSAPSAAGATLPARLLGVKDAARYLGLSPFTVRNMLKDGRLHAIAIPGVVRILIDVRDLDALIDGLKAKPA